MLDMNERVAIAKALGLAIEQIADRGLEQVIGP
jgi:hypothetical protein